MINICFHGIGTPGRTLEAGEDRYWIDRDRYYALLDEIARLPDAQISFDDGNASDIEIGLPGLLERGLQATFFVLAGRLGQAGSLDIEELQELRRHQMKIGTHGMDHRPWTGLSTHHRKVELDDARRRLEAVLAVPVDTAAVPLGRYDRPLLTQLRRRGYQTVYTSDRRPSQGGAWLQPRYSIRAQDDAPSLRREIFADTSRPVRLATSLKGVVKRLI